jgi:putative ATPase
MHLRNAPTGLTEDLGYGEGYRYAHDEAGAVALGEVYFPDDMQPAKYYHPVARGLEIRIREKLEDIERRARERIEQEAR